VRSGSHLCHIVWWYRQKSINPFFFIYLNNSWSRQHRVRKILKKRNKDRQTDKNTSYDTNINMYCHWGVRRGSSVGIETRYELDGLGIETRWEQDFTHLPRSALSLFFWDKEGTTWRWPFTTFWRQSWIKSRAITLLSIWALVAGYRVYFTLIFAAMSEGGANKLFRNSH
jgi:hypothetical protein